MSTVARDPMALKPGLPPGGSPAIDAAFERWLREFLEECNEAWYERNITPTGELAVASELVRTYQVTGHLFKYLNGWAKYPDGTGPNYLHRLRLVAVQFHYRREELVAEAGRYVAGLAEACR